MKFLTPFLVAGSLLSTHATANKFSVSNISVDNFKCAPSKDVSFELAPDGVSHSNFYMTIIASWLSHERNPDIRAQQLNDWGFTNHIDLLKDGFGHRGYVAVNDEYAIVAFRGTETADDYKSNSLFYQTKFKKELGIKKAKVHRGMAGIYRNVEKEFFAALEKLNVKSKPVVLMGHSLGGSLSILYGYKLKKLGYDVRGIYTAGAPKVGNTVLRKELEDKIGSIHQTVSLDTDITPMVPPAKTSAREFSNIISKRIPALRGFFHGLVKRIDFDNNPGSHFILSRNKELSTASLKTEANLNRREITYWKEITTRLSDRSNLEELSTFIKSRFNTHQPDNYICGLTDFLNNK